MKGAYAVVGADGLLVVLKTAQALPRSQTARSAPMALWIGSFQARCSSGRASANCYGFIGPKTAKIGSSTS